MITKSRIRVIAGMLISMLAIALSGAVHAAEPESYSEAVEQIEHRRDAIAKLIENGKLDGLHKEGEVIKKIAQSLAKLASKDGSGVAKADIKEVNIAAKALAATYEPLDEAGDGGKKEESKKVYEEIVKLTATLKKFAKAK